MSDYSRGDYADLPAGTTDLENNYSAPDLTAIASNDNSTYADQTANNEYAIHQYKKTVTSQYTNILWSGKSSLAPSESPVILEVYNVDDTAWEELDRDDSTAADTDFDLSYNNLATADYLDTGVITWRVYQNYTAAASAWTYPDNEIDITGLITYSDSQWNNVDLSSLVPGAKLALLHIRNSSGTTAYECETRMTASSYDVRMTLAFNQHSYIVAPLDTNGVFSGWFANSALLVGISAYSSSGSGIDKVNVGATAYGSWTNKDVSASIVEGSTIAIINHLNVGRSLAFHKDGSSMDTNTGSDASTPQKPSSVFVGLVSGVYEYYVGADGYNGGNLYLSACDDKIIELDDKVVLTPASTGEWVDVTCTGIPAGSSGALVMMRFHTYIGGTYKQAVRKKIAGTGDDFTVAMTYDRSIMVLVGLDANLKFQAYYENITNAALYLIGYTQ